MPTTESTNTTDIETSATVEAAPEAAEAIAAQTGFPADTPIRDMTPEQELAYWRHQAREHERKWQTAERTDPAAAKTAAELRDLRRKAAEYDKHVESQKSEQQKLTEAAEKARKEAADTAAELARMKAAVKHGLAEADLELLANVPADQVEARAELLAARLKGAIPPVAPATALGNVGSPVHETGDQIKDLDARIAEADKARNFALAIQLKRQRAALAGAKN